MRTTILAFLALILTPLLAGAAAAHPVLMISIDGLRSRDVTEAPVRGLTLPTFRKLMADGAWADGVKDMLPSVTYPNHTTLVTGVAPALHGIAGNLTFDPLQKNMEGWYWYASDVKVPTLFDAVHDAGKVSMNSGWPVTVGNRSITDNIPEYWRAYTAACRSGSKNCRASSSSRSPDWTKPPTRRAPNSPPPPSPPITPCSAPYICPAWTKRSMTMAPARRKQRPTWKRWTPSWAS
jgi:hypothetical protein